MDRTPKVAAVIVAAGNSTRMASGISKQLIPLCGVPVIAHTLMAFEKAHSIYEIVVVARESDMSSIEEISRDYNISKLKGIVTGGSLRSDSVKNGVIATSQDIDYVAIHDGARPLILPEAIDRASCSALVHKAVALMVPVTDTIKVVDSKGVIVSTPERKTLRAAQTPQIFEKTLYMEALEKTKSAGIEFTDDCALVEYIGAEVFSVDGDYTNIKLTTPSDVGIAENILKSRGEYK